jgi:PhoH-like ATPase
MKSAQSKDDKASKATVVKLPISYILDTNVPLHEASCLFKFHEHNVIIPIQVFGELDTFKKGSEIINLNAREFCRTVEKLSDGHIFNGGVSLGEGLGKLSISMRKPWNEIVKENLIVDNVDNQIINLAYCLQKEHPEREFIIVSKDINLRLQAKALGVLAQDFMHDKVADISILSEQIKTVTVTPKIIDSLYNSKMPVHLDIEDAKANQNFILSSGPKSTALVKYRNGVVTLIQKDKMHSFDIRPKNAEQAFSMDALLDPSITIVTLEGIAGTGKTILALACGLEQKDKDVYDQILFSRQIIEMGPGMGFLPGDVDAKIGPYMNGMKDNLGVIMKANSANVGKIDGYKRNETLIIEPLSFIRGRSFQKAFFILDEAQNLTPHEMKTIITRAGEGTKFVIIGDTRQIDNHTLDQRSNGFSYLIEKFKGQDCYAHVNLFKSERSELAALAAELL